MTRRPAIGLGVAYYGGYAPEHGESIRACLRDGIPVLEIHGCAYPEMARAEVLRDAWSAQIDCVVLADVSTAFSVADVRDLARVAIELDAVATGFYVPGKREAPWKLGRNPIEVEPHAAPWGFGDAQGEPCGFTAVPRSVLEALDQCEARHFTNSIGIDTQMKTKSRPYFSPWQKGAPGSLETIPVAEGIYCHPDVAFLLRVRAAGKRVFQCGHMLGLRSLRTPSYRLGIRNAPSADAQKKRKDHDISTNYAICVPSYGAVDREQQAQLWELEKAGVVILELNGCPFIDQARAELTAIALDQLGCDGVFFLDHDIIFRPVDALSVIAEAERRQDVVAGIYNMRSTGHALIGAPDVPRDTLVPFFEIGQVVPAFYSGLGFAAIPRIVIERMRDSFPELQGFRGKVHPLYALDVNGTFYAGEDTSFCGRVQGLTIKQLAVLPAEHTPQGVDWDLERDESKNPTGHRVWLDTRPRLFHKGTYHYGIEDHSIGVPRYAKLEMKLTATRAEAREFFRRADELPREHQLRALGLDEAAKDPHSGFAE